MRLDDDGYDAHDKSECPSGSSPDGVPVGVIGDERDDPRIEYLIKQVEGLSGLLTSLHAQNSHLLQWHTDNQAATNPILTIAEAADLIRVSESRLRNIISDYRRDHGKQNPPFICDAAGELSDRVDREKLLEWLGRDKKRMGRPPKRGRAH